MAANEVKTSSPLCVASQRLKQRKENVIEQLKCAEKFVSKLCFEKDAMISRLDEECNLVENEVSSLKRVLEEKKVAIIEELKEGRKEELDKVSASVELTNEAISKSNKVVCDASDLEKEMDPGKFFPAYSLINNSLEQMFIDLLLLMDGCKADSKQEEKAVIDLSGIVEAVKAVTINRSDESAPVKPVRLVDMVSLERNETPTCANEMPAELETSALDTAVIDCRVLQLEHLQLFPRASMEVCVSEMCGPQRFTVQPAGTELITLMKDIGDHYSKESCDDCQYTPKVADFCCAQFTEDDCWYRAKVMEVLNSEENEDVQVSVNYVDYGNEEELPFIRLRPLDSKFSTLPCQALHCSLGDLSQQPSDLWYENIFDWFSSLLLGKNTKIVTSEDVDSSDVLPVEVLVPWEELKKSTCLNLILPKEMLNKDFVPLSVFMDTVGLSCIDRALESRAKVGFIHISRLPPLVVKLNSSREFTCLMSHVSDSMHFYLHPVQENLAHDMTFISNELCDNFSSAEESQMLPEHIQCGSVCCVFSVDFQQWCRGVVVSLKKEQGEGKPECLVFYLDYGGSEWMEPSKLFSLPKSLQKLPSQVVCCSFDELTANSSRRGGEGKMLLTNPDLGSFENHNNYMCSIVQQELASKGVEFISTATEEKQLFVVVKETGMDSEDVLLLHKVNCVLPVDLYDTTGDGDLHINEEVVKAVTLVSNQKSEDCDHGLVDLQDWNPMEEDYLSKRNIYKIDDEDTGLALDGYRSTGRICHYYASGKRCYRGDKCPFMHLQEGLSNKQVEEAVVESEGFVKLPKKDDWVVVIVTAIITATRFYVQLPLGCTSPLSLEQCKEEELPGSDVEQDFFTLLEEMRDFYNQQVYTERDVILPHTGEIVAVHYVEDDYWYRARVIDSVDDSLNVFFVDYGNMASVLDIHVRRLKPEYLVVPFQAYECFLPDLHHSPGYVSRQHHARECLTDCVQDKVLVAKVLAVEANGCLGMELYCNDEEGLINGSINEALVEREVLRVESMKRVSRASAKSTLMRPG